MRSCTVFLKYDLLLNVIEIRYIKCPTLHTIFVREREREITGIKLSDYIVFVYM